MTKNDQIGCYEISFSGNARFSHEVSETCIFLRFVVARKTKLSRLGDCKHHRKNLLDGFGHDVIILPNSDLTFHTIHLLHC